MAALKARIARNLGEAAGAEEGYGGAGPRASAARWRGLGGGLVDVFFLVASAVRRGEGCVGAGVS